MNIILSSKDRISKSIQKLDDEIVKTNINEIINDYMTDLI